MKTDGRIFILSVDIICSEKRTVCPEDNSTGLVQVMEKTGKVMEFYNFFSRPGIPEIEVRVMGSQGKAINFRELKGIKVKLLLV